MTSQQIRELAAAGFSEGALPVFPLSDAELAATVAAALKEDCSEHDVTTQATIPPAQHAVCRMVSRQTGMIAGVSLACEAFRHLDRAIDVTVEAEDGTAVVPGSSILSISGHARAILSAERVALNFIQRLSGIASLTARYVAAVRGTKARILDTRKTTPGWRRLEKYAVRCGGGLNHRADLAAAVLIKDNHLAAVDGDMVAAVKRARAIAPPVTKVEVECDNLRQVALALSSGADIIMLDNMALPDLESAVSIVGGAAVLEASGGVSLETVRRIAETGVDWISVGALTHSAAALDLGLDFT